MRSRVALYRPPYRWTVEWRHVSLFVLSAGLAVALTGEVSAQTTTVKPGTDGSARMPTPVAMPAAPAQPARRGQPPVNAPQGPIAPQADPASTPYLLQFGDVVDVKFFYNPDLNETVPVRSDGRISLQLVGDVVVAGRSTEDVRAELMRVYGQTLKQPEVAVIVKEMAVRRIYIGGEVNAPGLLRMTASHLTLLQALFEAGGPKRSGKVSNIVVLRYQGTREPQFLTVDLRPALKKGAAGSDVALEPSDIVWVPKTKIAKVNDFMDQYSRQLMPIPLSLGISYVFGGLKP